MRGTTSDGITRTERNERDYLILEVIIGIKIPCMIAPAATVQTCNKETLLAPATTAKACNDALSALGFSGIAETL